MLMMGLYQSMQYHGMNFRTNCNYIFTLFTREKKTIIEYKKVNLGKNLRIM